MTYEDDDVLTTTVGYICWALIIYISLESINSFFQVFKGPKTGFLQCLVLFNIFSNVFSYLTTWIVVMFSFEHRFTYYMIIECIGHAMMVNSYLWLIYNRLKVFSYQRPHRVWFWLCVLQPIVTFIDVFLFSLDIGAGVVPGLFAYSGSVFFLLVILMETALNIATMWCLIKLSKSKTAMFNSLTSNLGSPSTGSQANIFSRKERKKTERTRLFIYHAVFTMSVQIVIDILLVLLNFLINAFVFILIKRVAFTIKTRIMIYMFDESTKVLLSGGNTTQDSGLMKSSNSHVTNFDSSMASVTMRPSTANVVVLEDFLPNGVAGIGFNSVKKSSQTTLPRSDSIMCITANGITETATIHG